MDFMGVSSPDLSTEISILYIPGSDNWDDEYEWTVKNHLFFE